MIKGCRFGSIFERNEADWEFCWFSDWWQVGEQDWGERAGDSELQERLKQKRLGVAYESPRT